MTLRRAAVELPLDERRVQRPADVLGDDVAEDRTSPVSGSTRTWTRWAEVSGARSADRRRRGPRAARSRTPKPSSCSADLGEGQAAAVSLRPDRPSTSSRSPTSISRPARRTPGSSRAAHPSALRCMARPVEYVTTLPPLIGDRGAEAVSAADDRDVVRRRCPVPRRRSSRSRSSPGHVDDTGDDRHAVPSASRRHTAEAGWRPPGQAPTATPTPSPSAVTRAPPERMVGDPARGIRRARARPTPPVGHLVVAGRRVAPAQLDRVDLEACRPARRAAAPARSRLGRARPR